MRGLNKKNLISFYSNDYAVSVGFHFLKIAIALLLNVLILKLLSLQEFTQYTLGISILAVATSFDFGIGQYYIANSIGSDQVSRTVLMRNSLVALFPLSILAGIFIYLELNGSIFYLLLMATIVAVRLIFIPYGAALNSVNLYKIRKFTEFLVYLLIIMCYLIIWQLNMSIETYLFLFNFILLIGALSYYFITNTVLNLNPLNLKNIKLSNVWVVYISAFPYGISILGGILSYSGFLWISSYILQGSLMGKLAFMQTFLMLPVVQFYEVILNSRQANLARDDNIKSNFKICLLIMSALPICLFIFWPVASKFPFMLINLNFSELFIFTIFVSIEIGFILIRSILQVRLNFSKQLLILTFIKFSIQALSFAIAFYFRNQINLLEYLYIILFFSSIAYLMSIIYFFQKINYRH